MCVLFWIISVCFCFLGAKGSKTNSDILNEVLGELKQLKHSNELQAKRIADLENKLQGNRDEYDHKIAEQANKIAQLELLLSAGGNNGNLIPKRSTRNVQNDSTSPSNNRPRQLSGSPGIAFTAYLSKHSSNLGHQYTIPFDSIILNEGQAFNTNTHEFTCPVSGVYTFQTALLSQASRIAITEIVKEGVQLVQAHAESTSFDQGFNSVVTKCNKGERVWVRNFQHFGTTVYSERYTTFTGFLLWETEEFASVVG